MKLRTEIFTICDYASISRENKLSVNGIFDEVRINQFPGGLPRAFVVATFSGVPETSYGLTLKLENGKKVLQNLDFDIHTSPNGKYNFVFEIVGLGFEGEGEYKFVVYNGKEEVGSTTLKVIHVIQPKSNIRSVN